MAAPVPRPIFQSFFSWQSEVLAVKTAHLLMHWIESQDKLCDITLGWAFNPLVVKKMCIVGLLSISKHLF